MALTVYPSIPIPSYSYVFDSEFRTLVSDMESGKEQRRIMWRFPKRTVSIIYKVQDFTSTGRDALYEYFQNRRGVGETFWYFDFKKRKIIDEFVGYGTGAAVTFDLHSKSTESGTVIAYVNGTQTAVTFVSGGGEGGADRITFSSAPALGALITSDFRGYLRIKGRFKNDKLSEELFTFDYQNILITVFEVKN